jgi:hypothetical protein
MRNVKILSSILGTLALSATLRAAAADPIPRADVDAIFRVGTEQRSELPTELLDGTYVVGPITGDEIQEETFMMIESDVNDSEKFYALMIPKPLPTLNPRQGHPQGIARLYQGRRLGGSGSLMLAPLNISPEGNLEISSETQTRAPVLELSSRPGRLKYPYVLQGKNGALGGQILGMRGWGGKKPALKASPADGVFVSGSKHADLVVSYPELSFYDGSARGASFNLLDMNGDEGKFAMMLESALDTIAETKIANEQIKRIAVFASGGCFDSEVLLTLIPRAAQGEYAVTLYRPAVRTLWEIVFPGRRIPRNAQR